MNPLQSSLTRTNTVLLIVSAIISLTAASVLFSTINLRDSLKKELSFIVKKADSSSARIESLRKTCLDRVPIHKVSKSFRNDLVPLGANGRTAIKVDSMQPFRLLGVEGVKKVDDFERNYRSPFFPPLMLKQNTYNLQVSHGAEYARLHASVVDFEKENKTAQISSLSLRLPDNLTPFSKTPVELFGEISVDLRSLEDFYYHMRTPEGI